jgi:hypothetical protein
MPSATAATGRGFRTVTRHLARSLLYDDWGVPLACLLDGPNTFRSAQQRAPELFASLPPLSAVAGDDRDGLLLRESVKEWIGAARAVGGTPMERGLTRLLSSKTQGALGKDGMAVAHDEKLVTCGGGFPDILVRSQYGGGGGRAGGCGWGWGGGHDDEQHPHPPVLLVEAGLQNGQWRVKVDQALLYAAGLRSSKRNQKKMYNNGSSRSRSRSHTTAATTTIPMLVTALTLERIPPTERQRRGGERRRRRRRLAPTTAKRRTTPRSSSCGGGSGRSSSRAAATNRRRWASATCA